MEQAVRIWNVETENELKKTELSNCFFWFPFYQMKEKLFSGGYNHKVRMRNFESKKKLKKLEEG